MAFSIQRFSRPVALTRLKANLFILFLACLVKTIFTPYRTIRHGLIWLIDEQLGAGIAEPLIWYSEWILLALLSANAAQAGLSLQYPPPPVLANTNVKTYAPVQPSPPATRKYPTPEAKAAGALIATPNRGFQTPTKQTPGSATHRPSPLSSSTAKILNLPHDTTPSKTGLFFSSESQQGGTQEVLVDKSEKEWVDNAWKGVRGKGGRVGL